MIGMMIGLLKMTNHLVGLHLSGLELAKYKEAVAKNLYYESILGNTGMARFAWANLTIKQKNDIIVKYFGG